MDSITYISLREKPALKETAAEWFHNNWGVPKEAYLKCMNVCPAGEVVRRLYESGLR